MEKIMNTINRSPGKPEPVYKQIERHFKVRIKNQDFLPGQRLPSLSEIVKKFDVGYPTARTAIAGLESDGLVKTGNVKGVGPVVLGNHRKAQKCCLGFVRWDSNSQFLEYENGIKQYVNEQGLDFELIDTMGNSELFFNVIHQSFGSDGGLIIVPWDLPYYKDAISKAVAKGTHVVFVDRFLEGIDISSVSSDHYDGAYQATKTMLEAHHCGVNYLGYIETPTSCWRRYRGYISAMHEYHFMPEIDKQFIWKWKSTEADNALSWSKTKKLPTGKDDVIEFFKKSPQDKYCILCMDERTAMYAATAAKELGYEVGKNVFIACFGDKPLYKNAPYPIICINQHEKAVGYKAAQLLHKEIIEGKKNAVHIVIPVDNPTIK